MGVKVNNQISVVGLGKLGLPLATCLADSGFQTIGIDVNEKVIELINNGISPIVEPGLDEMISRLGGQKLIATKSHAKAIEQTNITFILVATPSNTDGEFSNKYIKSVLKSLAIAFGKSKKKYHLFIISSTVYPGSTENEFIPLIEKYSGKTKNSDFGICYDPEIVALGSVVKDFFYPDYIVIGEGDHSAGEQVLAIHKKMCKNEPHISRVSIISAEIAKMTMNAYITVKISFVNSLANICEKIPGADVDGITKAIGADKRISPHFFQGGLSFGGTCFPRDTRAFINFAKQYGSSAELINAAEEINRHQDEHLLEIVIASTSNTSTKTVGILGLSFKPDTPVIVESPSIKLIRGLLNHDCKIVVYDEHAIANTKALFGDTIEYAYTVEDCLNKSYVSVVTLRSNKLKNAIESYIPKSHMKIIDCWRLIDHEILDSHFDYEALGRFKTKTKK